MNDPIAVAIEPARERGSRSGRAFAAVFPHSDDFTIFTGGLILKLIEEGYTGYFIRTTNDMVDSARDSPGETMRNIEREMAELTRVMGIERLYDFNYMNHYLCHGQITELRHRLMTIFRMKRIDTVISFDPTSHHEENPDHTITALAVEQACWMAGCRTDLMELEDAGIEPFDVKQKFYLARWPHQATNLVVDIEPYVEGKLSALLCNRSPMIKMCGSDEPERLKAYVRGHFIDRQEPYMGLAHYEKYYHIGS